MKFKRKKPHRGGYVVGETRISNCATDEEKISQNNSLWTSQR